MVNLPQIVSGVTIVIGLLVMIGSSLFLNQIQPFYDVANLGCDYVVDPAGKEYCSAMKGGMAAAAIGIIVSIIQILFGIYAVIKLKEQVDKIWQGIHALLCVLSIVCFAIGIHFQDYYKVKLSNGIGKLSEDTPRFFYAITMIDAIFCIIAIVLSFTMFKSK